MDRHERRKRDDAVVLIVGVGVVFVFAALVVFS